MSYKLRIAFGFIPLLLPLFWLYYVEANQIVFSPLSSAYIVIVGFMISGFLLKYFSSARHIIARILCSPEKYSVQHSHAYIFEMIVLKKGYLPSFDEMYWLLEEESSQEKPLHHKNLKFYIIGDTVYTKTYKDGKWVDGTIKKRSYEKYYTAFRKEYKNRNK